MPLNNISQKKKPHDKTEINKDHNRCNGGARRPF